MTMSNLHPGFILIAVGLIALFVPKSLRRPVLAAGPLLGLGAVLTLAPGTNATLPFINGITLHYLHVDALSWIFALIFCMMAAIGGIYSRRLFYTSHAAGQGPSGEVGWGPGH